jgi:hypothetical protein
MPPKKGTSTPNKPLENPTWTLDEGEEMHRDKNDLQKVTKDELQEMMDSTEAKFEAINTKMDSLKGEIMEVLKHFVTKKTVLTGEIDRPSTERVEPVWGCLITQAVWDEPP